MGLEVIASPGAFVGDGGTADKLIIELYEGKNLD